MNMNATEKGLFIIGTDTGVGKTLIGEAIARAFLSDGIDCGVMKPIESGCRREEGRLTPTDGNVLKEAAQSEDSIDLITPCRYEPPLAPYAALMKRKGNSEGSVEPPNIDQILSAYWQLQSKHDFMIVEGVGGLLVPLSENLDLIDLIRLLDLPVLLVARSGLGTLNHVLLTVRHGEKKGLSFIGIILNQISPEKPPSEETNRLILTERLKLPVAVFPYFKSDRDFKGDCEERPRIKLRTFFPSYNPMSS